VVWRFVLRLWATFSKLVLISAIKKVTAQITSMDAEENADSPADEPVKLPIDGVLDLHTFRPSDVKPVVLDYIELCRERGILELRIIHGKGIGQLRATVHSILAQHPAVERFALASEYYGGAGATIVRLKAYNIAKER
jgi:dsDNA-specific endonuclease/ATPase MutS2